MNTTLVVVKTEIGLRAWQYGYRVLYVPSSIVFHIRGASFKKTDLFQLMRKKYTLFHS